MNGPILRAHPDYERFKKWGYETLRPSLLDRDQEAVFPATLWSEAARTNLFRQRMIGGKLDYLGAARMIYGLAEGGLDLPVASSIAAHAVIARDLLERFGSSEQKAKYSPLLEAGQVRAAIANTETGAGTELRNIQSACEIDAEGHALFRFAKPCVTNGTGSLFFVSAWKRTVGGASQIAIYIVEGSEASVSDLAPTLASFRTGMTGAIRGEIAGFPHAVRQLNDDAFRVFKHCFHLERLFLGVIVSGALRGLESETYSILKGRAERLGKPVREQWLMDKLLVVASARIKIEALVSQILVSQAPLETWSEELGVLKTMINEDAFAGASAFFEALGHQGIMKSHIAQKMMRDMMALRFFGGTTELQKLSLFGDLTERHSAIDGSRC